MMSQHGNSLATAMADNLVHNEKSIEGVTKMAAVSTCGKRDARKRPIATTLLHCCGCFSFSFYLESAVWGSTDLSAVCCMMGSRVRYHYNAIPGNRQYNYTFSNYIHKASMWTPITSKGSENMNS